MGIAINNFILELYKWNTYKCKTAFEMFKQFSTSKMQSEFRS